MDSTLRLAQEIAVIGHFGQLDKHGEPFIDHPLRVMRNVHGVLAKTVAVLHDLVEDRYAYGWTFSKLNNFFDREVLFHLGFLTKMPGEPYFNYLDRAMQNRITCEVKRADVLDNSLLYRALPGKEQKYIWAEQRLSDYLDRR